MNRFAAGYGHLNVVKWLIQRGADIDYRGAGGTALIRASRFGHGMYINDYILVVVYIFIYIFICMYVCMCLCVCVRMYVHIYVYIMHSIDQSF
jgi:hypothetical protein